MKIYLSKSRYMDVTSSKNILIMIWMIMLSGVWSIKLPDVVAFYLELVTTAIFLFKLFISGKRVRGIKVACFLSALLFLEMFIHSEPEAWSTYIALICCIFIGLYFANIWGEVKTSFYYRKVMLGITVLALIGYFSQNMLLSMQAGFPRIEAQSATYINYYFYMYCIESPSRNPGIFWEPGAFAVFIGIALFFELRDSKQTSIIKLLIYWIALITTGSTLAYTVLFITIVLYLFNTNKLSNIGIKTLCIAIAFAAVFSSIVELGVFSNIQTKLLGGLNNDPSSRVRNVGQLMDLAVFSKYPIFGSGYANYTNLSHSIGNVFGESYVLSANTFSHMLALFGLIFTGIVCYGIVKAAIVRGNKLASIIDCVLIIWLFITQGFLNKPIFYILVFIGIVGHKKTFDEKESARIRRK